MGCAPLPWAESSALTGTGELLMLLLFLPGTSSCNTNSGFPKSLLAVLEARWQCCLEREALALCTPGTESLFHVALQCRK